MERDERVMILGLDVGRLGGVFRTTDGMIEKFGRKRVFDTPLAEASIIGSAIGLAISGLVPVAEIQFLGFTHQAFHQMGAQLGRYRYRSRGRYPLPVTVRAPLGAGTKTSVFHLDAIEAQRFDALFGGGQAALEQERERQQRSTLPPKLVKCLASPHVASLRRRP